MDQTEKGYLSDQMTFWKALLVKVSLYWYKFLQNFISCKTKTKTDKNASVWILLNLKHNYMTPKSQTENQY